MSIFCKTCKYIEVVQDNENKSDYIYVCMKDTQSGQDKCNDHKNISINDKDINKWLRTQINLYQHRKYKDTVIFIIKMGFYYTSLLYDKLTINFAKVMLDKFQEAKKSKSYSEIIMHHDQIDYIMFLLQKFIEYKDENYEHWIELLEISFNSYGKKILKNLF